MAAAEDSLGTSAAVAKDDSRIPTGRVRRTAKVGTVIGGAGARYAGTRAANVARSKERRDEALEQTPPRGGRADGQDARAR